MGRVKRQDAERRLRKFGSKPGSFLVRESDTQIGNFALSIFDGSNVKHYRIRRADSGGFFVTPNQIFHNLNLLILHYQSGANGLVTKLGEPCLWHSSVARLESSAETILKDDLWEVDRSTLATRTKLGAGQFGEVWSGVWNDSTPVAIKMLKSDTMDQRDFLAEAQIMKSLQHPKLVQLYAVCTKEEPIYIITELMTQGSLLNYLQSTEGKKLHLCELIDIAAQTSEGMAYLESKKFIHRDLAARNILVGDNNVVKVADFGLARLTRHDEYRIRGGTKFPVKWTAPEAIFFYSYSIKSDVWSFGILLTELVTYGRTPYEGMTKSEVLEKLQHGYRMECPSNCPDALYDIMLSCWKGNPEERPTFEYLKYLLEDYFISAEEHTYVGQN